MPQLVVYYDPKSRIELRKDRMPKDVRYAAIHLVEMPEEASDLKKLAVDLTTLLLDNIDQ